MAPHIADLVHAERHALADDLVGFDPAAWDSPSLCEGWSVEDVVAHLTQRNVSTPLRLVAGAARHGGLQRFIDAGIREHRGPSAADTLARFRETADRAVPGPGALQTYLGELVIHAEDIRRPLGITHQYPRAEVSRLLSERSRLARHLLHGLQLVATDTGLIVGRGPSVRGPAMSLLMVVSGRRAHAQDLTGPGAAALSARLQAR